MRTSIVILALCVALGTACGDSTAPDSITGTYTLRKVNGESLPCCGAKTFGNYEIDGELLFAELTRVLVSGSLQLNDDATFLVAFVAEETVVGYDPLTGNEVARIVTTLPAVTHPGTYTVNGMSIQFILAGGDAFTGSVSGDAITIAWDRDYVFVR